MQSIERLRQWVRNLGIFCAITSASFAAYADAPNLAGTWRATTTQTALKPESGAIPFTAEGKQRYAENKRFKSKKQFDEFDYTTARCSAPGVPRVFLMPGRMQIFQRPDLILMAFEWNHLRRVIAMPELARQQSLFGDLGDTNAAGTIMGTSKGRWEGDTLVVVTDQFNESSLIDDLLPHGYDLKVTERIRLKDANTLENRITLEDPQFFTRPWSTVLTFKRQPDAAFQDDICLDRLQGQPPLPTK